MPEYVPANHDVITWASDTYGLDAAELGLLYDVREHRAVFPIMHEGKIVTRQVVRWASDYLNGVDMERVACHMLMVVVKSP